jgi:hypothetical protein
VQVWIDRDDAVEAAGQEGPDRLLADRRARPVDRILAHVAKVGRDQDQPFRPSATPGVLGEHQLDELWIGSIQAAVDDGDGRRRRHEGDDLAVWKGVDLDERQG